MSRVLVRWYFKAVVFELIANSISGGIQSQISKCKAVCEIYRSLEDFDSLRFPDFLRIFIEFVVSRVGFWLCGFPGLQFFN